MPALLPTLALVSVLIASGCVHGERQRAAFDTVPGHTAWMRLNCSMPEGERAVPCGIRLAWWDIGWSIRPGDPYWKDNVSAGLNILSFRCADLEGAERDARACLYLGDAYAAGRGVARSPGQAAFYYGLGCARSAGESACPGPRGPEPFRTGSPELDQWTAPRSACNVSCRRLEDPLSIANDPLEDARVDIRAFGPLAPLGDRDSLLAAGAAFAASRPIGSFDWMRGILAVRDLPLSQASLSPAFNAVVDARWAIEVAPLEAKQDWAAALAAARGIVGVAPSGSGAERAMALYLAAAAHILAAAERSRHYLPAIAQLTSLIGQAQPGDVRLAPLSSLRAAAADYHRAAAARSGPMLAALHHEVAQRALGAGVGPLASLRAELVDGILSVSVTGPSCAWLVAPVAAAFPSNPQSSGAELAVSCTQDEAFASQSGTITRYRTVSGAAAGRGGYWESYPCQRIEGGHMTREGWVLSGAVPATCQRWVDGAASAATSATEVAYDESFHVATRTLRATVSGTLRIGERPPVSIAVAREDVEVVPVLEQKFSDRPIGFVQRRAAEELVAAVRKEALVLVEARAVSADHAARTASGKKREEAYVLAILYGIPSPPAVAWLRAELGIEAAALGLPARFTAAP